MAARSNRSYFVFVIAGNVLHERAWESILRKYFMYGELLSFYLFDRGAAFGSLQQPRSQGFSPPRRRWAGKDLGIGWSRD